MSAEIKPWMREAAKAGRLKIGEVLAFNGVLSTDEIEEMLAAVIAEAHAAHEREQGEWTKAIDGHPPRGHKCEVRRPDTGIFVATPCYGMHSPWWVPRTVDLFSPGSTVIPIRDDDEWRPLKAALASGGDK